MDSQDQNSGKNDRQKSSNQKNFNDSDSSDDSKGSKSENEENEIHKFLPPCNPLMPKVYREEFEIKSIFDCFEFKPQPTFIKNQNYNFVEPADKKYDINLQDYMNIESNKNRLKKQAPQVNSQDESIKDNNANNNGPSQVGGGGSTLKGKNLLQFHKENKEKLVYQRFPDINLDDPTKINDKYYFATYISKLKNIMKKAEQEQLVTTKKPQNLGTVTPKQKKQSDSENSLEEQKEQKEIQLKLESKPSEKKDAVKSPLIFDSRFESGNLFCAYQTTESEYDLILQNDINTKGNTQWFYFSVENMKKGQTIKFNMLNLMKPGSLFNDGLCPAVYSLKQNELKGDEWTREGFDISYYKGNLTRDGVRFGYYRELPYYTLTFTYTFLHDMDKVYFAHSYPYTFTDLNEYINKIMLDTEKNKCIAKKRMCRTLAGNSCDIFTITSNSIKQRNYRKGIVIFARQHPGETGGSWMMQGVLDFLTENTPEAEFLREKCVFKVIPMMNPDGVVHGNYRCSLAGCDLNRRWKKPRKKLHPTVNSLKEMIKKFQREREIKLIIDLHGHSRKLQAFFYGCSYKEDPVVTRVYPYLMSKLNSMISFQECRFNVDKSKEKTARIALWKELRIPNVFTLEASFFGYKDQNQKPRHFNIKDLLEIGKDLCVNLFNIMKEESGAKDDNGKFQVNQQKIYDEMNEQKLLECGDNSDSGSDSNPSEDELPDEDIIKIFPKSVMTKKQKNLILLEAERKLKAEREKNKPQPPEPKKLSVKPLPRPKVDKKEEEKKPELVEMKDQFTQTDASFIQELKAFLKRQQQARGDKTQSLNGYPQSYQQNQNNYNKFMMNKQNQLNQQQQIQQQQQQQLQQQAYNSTKNLQGSRNQPGLNGSMNGQNSQGNGYQSTNGTVNGYQQQQNGIGMSNSSVNIKNRQSVRRETTTNGNIPIYNKPMKNHTIQNQQQQIIQQNQNNSLQYNSQYQPGTPGTQKQIVQQQPINSANTSLQDSMRQSDKNFKKNSNPSNIFKAETSFVKEDEKRKLMGSEPTRSQKKFQTKTEIDLLSHRMRENNNQDDISRYQNKQNSMNSQKHHTIKPTTPKQMLEPSNFNQQNFRNTSNIQDPPSTISHIGYKKQLVNSNPHSTSLSRGGDKLPSINKGGIMKSPIKQGH